MSKRYNLVRASPRLKQDVNDDEEAELRRLELGSSESSDTVIETGDGGRHSEGDTSALDTEKGWQVRVLLKWQRLVRAEKVQRQRQGSDLWHEAERQWRAPKGSRVHGSPAKTRGMDGTRQQAETRTRV